MAMTSVPQERIFELRELLAKNPGDSSFVELAKILVEHEEARMECREVCFRGLSHAPKQLMGRIILARSFYLDGMIEFAVRELVELGRHAELPSLERLLDAFGPHAGPYRRGATAEALQDQVIEEEDEEVLAEIDLDGEFVEEALDEIESELEVEFEAE